MRYKLLRIIGRLSWIRFGLRDRLIRFYRSPDKQIPEIFRVDFFGMKYTVNLNSFIDWNVYFYKAYELSELNFIKDVLKNIATYKVFIDVGANCGHHSMFVSRLCDEVHAFEPYSPLLQEFSQKKHDNHISNIYIHNYGLGAVNEVKTYYPPSTNNNGTGSFCNDHNLDNEKSITLNLVNGDSFINSLKLDTITIIKIDVEGFERNVILGLQKSISKHKPAVFFEFSKETKESFSDFNELVSMFPSDYKFKELICNQPYLFFFNKQKCTLKKMIFHKPTGNLVLAYPETYKDIVNEI